MGASDYLYSVTSLLEILNSNSTMSAKNQALYSALRIEHNHIDQKSHEKKYGTDQKRRIDTSSRKKMLEWYADIYGFKIDESGQMTGSGKYPDIPAISSADLSKLKSGLSVPLPKFLSLALLAGLKFEHSSYEKTYGDDLEARHDDYNDAIELLLRDGAETYGPSIRDLYDTALDVMEAFDEGSKAHAKESIEVFTKKLNELEKEIDAGSHDHYMSFVALQMASQSSRNLKDIIRNASAEDKIEIINDILGNTSEDTLIDAINNGNESTNKKTALTDLLFEMYKDDLYDTYAPELLGDYQDELLSMMHENLNQPES